jgi:hypothetical protein
MTITSHRSAPVGSAPGTGAERRRHPRVPVAIPGEIRADPLGPLPCRVLDLCLGGLRLLCPGGPDLAGRMVEVHLALPDGRHALRASAQVVHAADGALGARFLDLAEADALALRHYLERRVAGPAPARPAPERALAILTGLTRGHLDPLGLGLLEAMQESLWEIGRAHV